MPSFETKINYFFEVCGSDEELAQVINAYILKHPPRHKEFVWFCCSQTFYATYLKEIQHLLHFSMTPTYSHDWF